MQTFVHNRQPHRAFSLVEVVIAVGIFAISIVAVIGLLGPTNKSVADVRDTDDATRVMNAVQARLQSIAETSTGFTTVFGLLKTAPLTVTADGTSYHSSSPYKDVTIYANRDGSRIDLYTPTTTGIWAGTDITGAAQSNWNGLKYFEIVLIRNGDYPNAGDGLSPSANDGTAGFLAYTMRIRWPAYTPDGNEFTAHSQKNVILVPAAVHR